MNKKIFYTFLISLFVCFLYMCINVNTKYLYFTISTRFPKLIAMILASICIGISTKIFQTITQNRIITPQLLGLDSIYTLTHTLMFFLLGSMSIISNKNYMFIIDLVVMIFFSTIFYSISFNKLRGNTVFILLLGVIFSNFLNNIQSVLIRIIDPNEYDALITSLFANFNRVNKNIIALSLVIVVITMIYVFKNIEILDVMSLGKNFSNNLGVDHKKNTKYFFIVIFILVSTSTALVGPIIFLGLITANISIEILKTYKNKYLIIMTILTSVILIVISQILVEHVFNYSITPSIILSLIGAPYFLFLITRQGKKIWK